MMVFFLINTLTVSAQATGDFRSAATGNWEDISTWETFNGSDWAAASSSPSSTDGVITIRSPHTVTVVTTGLTYDQVVIDAGAQMTISSGIAVTIADGTGVDLVVNGTYLNSAATWSAGGSGVTWSVNAGGTYINNTTSTHSTLLSFCTINSASTFIFRGSSSMTPGVRFSSLVYGNVIIESSSGTFPSAASASVFGVIINGNLTISNGAVLTTTASGLMTVNGNMVIQNGGSYTASQTGTLTINGDFTVQSGGTFTSVQSGFIVFNGNFTNDGTFTCSTNTQNFLFGGTGKTIGGTNPINFENWSVSSGASISLGQDIGTAGGFTATDSGSLHCGVYELTGAGTFVIAPGATLGIGSDQGITSSAAAGNIQTTGRTFSTAANYLYNGTAAQVTGGGLPQTVAGLTVNNSAGVTLDLSTEVTNTLTLTSGVITLGSKHLTAATVSGGSSGSYVNASSSGTLRRTFSATGTAAFPVGDAANYSPASFTLSSAGGFSSAYVAISLSSVKHPSNTSSADFLKRYWTVSQSGISDPVYDIQLTYANADINGNESGIEGGLYNGSWSSLGAVNTTSNTISGTGLNSFGAFSGGEATALPIEIVSFAAATNKESVELKWMTATEENNFGFEIQRSEVRDQGPESGVWSNVGFVEGNGTTNTPHDYSFTDHSASAGTFAYRLKQIDRDGKFGYSTVTTVTVGSAPLMFDLAQIYPNPFNPSTNIEFTVPVTGKASLKVYNIMGQEVATLFEGIAKSGVIHRVTFHGSNMSSGIYLCRLVNGTNALVRKMLLTK
jgi:hypothetical protein